MDAPAPFSGAPPDRGAEMPRLRCIVKGIMNILRELARRQLLVVTGKGGVGKTLITGVLGALVAEQGGRVLAVEVDPRENLHQMLGVDPSGGAIVRTPFGVSLQNLRPRDVLDEIVRERVRLEMLVRRVLASPVYQTFTEGAPGLKELAILGHAAMQVRGFGRRAAQFDTVLLDAPATGHGLALLLAPKLVSEAIPGGPFGELAGELAEFAGDTARSGVVVVTAAEELPVEEALELRTSLGTALGRAPLLLVVNGLYPPYPGEEGGEPGGTREPVLAADAAHLRGLWRERRRVNEKERERLLAGWEGPVAELPLLALPAGPALVRRLAERLRGSLGTAGEARR
jgi:Mrp family chromosome partitioning ATPase